MPLVIPTIWTAVDKVSTTMSKMGNSMGGFASRAEGAMQRADRAVNKYTSVLGHAQKELLNTLGAAALAYKAMQAIEFGFDQVKEFDASIRNLQANFRLSDAAMIPFRASIIDVAKESHKAASDVTEVFNIIGSKNRDLIGNKDAMAAMAASSITLSEALKTELIPTAESFTGVMKGFGLKDSEKAADIIAAISSSGNVKGLALTEALKGLSQEARHANISLNKTGAMIEYIDSRAQDGGASGAAFTKTLLKLETLPVSAGYRNAKGLFDIDSAIAGMQKQLEKASPKARETLLKAWGISSPKAVAVGRALLAPGALEEIRNYEKQTEAVGLAEKMAAINGGSLEESIKKVKNSFGTALITNTSFSIAMDGLNKILIFTYTHMDKLVTIGTVVIGLFVAWKVGVFALTFAIRAWAIASNLAQLAMWSLNIAMAANPAGLLVIAFASMAILVYEMINHWNGWGKTVNSVLLIIMPPLGLVISLIQTMREEWTNITTAFSEKGFIAGIKAIGTAILDSILTPLQEIYALANKIFHFDIVSAAIKNMAHGNFGKVTDEQIAAQNKPAINSEKARQDSMVHRTESTQKQNTTIHIPNMPQGGSVTSDNDIVKIITGSTMGTGFNLNTH